MVGPHPAGILVGRRDGAARQTRQRLQDHKMKTVFVYINTATQLGDVDYVKVFANVEGLPKGGLRNMTLKASRSSMTF